jgi:hypothetical protein
LELLTVQQRDTNLKFDEQKKRFDSIASYLQHRDQRKHRETMKKFDLGDLDL